MEQLIVRLEAFARNCVINGDMTPTCERMLLRILDEYESEMSNTQ